MGKRKVLTEKELKDAPLPGEGQILGIVKKLLGNDRILTFCTDRKIRTCRIVPTSKLTVRVSLQLTDAVGITER